MGKLPAVLLLVAATGVWGATFTVVKGALADCGPLTFTALRFALAGALLVPQLGHLRASRGRGLMVACGVALFVGYAFQTWGLVTTTPARSAFITALSAVLVPLLEPLGGQVALAWRALGGAVVALAGLAVLLRPGTTDLAVGDVMTLGCAAAFAVHAMVLNRAVRQARPEVVNAVQVIVVALLALPAAGLEQGRLVVSARLGVALGVTAVLATVGAFWAMASAQRGLSAAETGVVLAFEPVAAAVVSILVREDTVSAGLLVGGALVVLGVVVTTVSGGRVAPGRGSR